MRKKKLYILCPYPFDVAPSQRLKVEQYYTTFKEAGYELKVSSFISPAFWKIIYKKGHFFSKTLFTVYGYLKRIIDVLQLPFYDVVYVHLWVTPFGLPFFERLVRIFSKHLVYDIDDMIYLKEQGSKANPLISGLKGRGKPIYLFRKADYILTSTDTIEDFAKELNPNVVNIPITIDTSIYTPKNNYTIEEKIILGWTGSYSTSAYLHLLEEVLLELNKECSFKLLVMGDENFRIPGLDVEAIPWKSVYEVETIKRFDIGLYPLPENQWVLGKGGGKALQYMALGVPTVATAIGANLKIIQNGQNGYLVNNKKEWVSVLKILMNNKLLREQIGQQGAKTVVGNYSVSVNKSKYLMLLDKPFLK